MTNHTTLHIDCLPEQKQRWMLSSRIADQSFEQWVKNTLDAAITDSAPAWLDGLSERARVCILGGGFDGRQELLSAIADGFDIAALPNAGRRVKNEVLAWLNK